jgi:cytochrome c oxidase subunit 2
MMADLGLGKLAGLPLAQSGGSFWFPPQSSTVAAGSDFTYFLILWLCIIFFVGICAATLYFMVKYRKRPGHKEEITSTHNTKLELAWSVIPLILLLVVFGVSTYWYLEMVTPPNSGVREVRVEASQWKWRFTYSGAPFTKNWTTKKLYLIKDKPYQMIMTTPDRDVIHSMFIPAFRVKQDCVPGRYNKLWFQPTETGEFDLFCTEYCGRDHSEMITKVVVVETEAEWKRLVETEYDPETYTIEDLGPVLYQDNCTSCHTLDGKEIAGGGPSFKGFGERWGKERKFADDTSRVVDEGYVKDSLEKPGMNVVEGYPNAMTSFNFNEKEREAIIAFLRKQ